MSCLKICCHGELCHLALDSWIFRELKQGISLADDDGRKIGQSPVAAQKAIGQVTFSRIAMAVPSMGMALVCFLDIRHA